MGVGLGWLGSWLGFNGRFDGEDLCEDCERG